MTTSLPLDDVATAFLELAELVYARDEYDDIHDAICRAALRIVPHCDHACIATLRGGHQPHLEATTDDVARRVDGLEWETGEGPCVDAIVSQRFEWDPDLTRDPTWPRLASAVLESTPVRGMIGYRILVGDRKAGALNLFSDTPGGFDEAAANLGAVLAAFASVALTAKDEHDVATNLRTGLASNREIGKAIGLLMATYDVSDGDAFEMLRTTSNGLNLRLAEIAGRLVDDHNGRANETAS
ncbi:GAF and ANTAR domain-containing protein [Nocardioides albidus]|uniref:GAF and ANTAR domain-containing protein n=1 Tax=Nocardioides albidus TaxID=1517589 RepID=A0A5C4W7W3_9ACTN|nr:GAF and ANTAR domain-containing protein [Nocardioides albidus]TNM44173.1 GAF and ANTAR domain-containing protein [Nocardioides albidus]